MQDTEPGRVGAVEEVDDESNQVSPAGQGDGHELGGNEALLMKIMVALLGSGSVRLRA